MTRFFNEIKYISKKITSDNVTGFAAQSCFYIILSFLPFLILLLNVFYYLPVDITQLMALTDTLVPQQFTPLIKIIINDVETNSSNAITWATLIAIIWSAGKGFLSIINGLNKIYETKTTRRWIVQRTMSTFYTILLIVVLVMSLGLLVFGNKLANILGKFLPGIALIIRAILNNKIIIFPAILILLFILIYRFVPNHKTTLASQLPGAVFSAFSWYLFSYIYSVYVAYAPSHMYGNLTTVILAFIWLYICMIIIFLGAELNFYLSKLCSGKKEL